MLPLGRRAREQYLYVTASSLKGEVLPGVARTGVIVFQRLTAPTDRLQIHFSGVRIGGASSGRSHFHFEYTDDDLPRAIEDLLALPPPHVSLQATLDDEERKIRRGVAPQQTGCAWAVVALVGTLVAGIALLGRGFFAVP